MPPLRLNWLSLLLMVNRSSSLLNRLSPMKMINADRVSAMIVMPLLVLASWRPVQVWWLCLSMCVPSLSDQEGVSRAMLSKVVSNLLLKRNLSLVMTVRPIQSIPVDLVD